MSIVILPMTSFGHFFVEAEQERAEMEATPAVWMFQYSGTIWHASLHNLFYRHGQSLISTVSPVPLLPAATFGGQSEAAS